MLSLASLRYRNILAADGGPVESIETGFLPVRGRQLVLANARLRSGLVQRERLMVFSDAEGSGTDCSATIARHKAVSEALERWAFHTLVRSERAAEYGFDVDPSSTGMAAFPGLLARAARRKAVLEGVERYCLCAWWEGRLPGRPFETDWPGVSAVAVEGPFGGVTVIVYARAEWGGYVYGHAAEESFGAACEHAVVELARHEWALRAMRLTAMGGAESAPTHLLERRCVFFASEAGHELFLERVRKPAAGGTVRPEVICDQEIPGPWTEYATVWRFALRPISDGYRRGGETYFFL